MKAFAIALTFVHLSSFAQLINIAETHSIAAADAAINLSDILARHNKVGHGRLAPIFKNRYRYSKRVQVLRKFFDDYKGYFDTYAVPTVENLSELHRNLYFGVKAVLELHMHYREIQKQLHKEWNKLLGNRTLARMEKHRRVQKAGEAMDKAIDCTSELSLINNYLHSYLPYVRGTHTFDAPLSFVDGLRRPGKYGWVEIQQMILTKDTYGKDNIVAQARSLDEFKKEMLKNLVRKKGDLRPSPFNLNHYTYMLHNIYHSLVNRFNGAISSYSISNISSKNSLSMRSALRLSFHHVKEYCADLPGFKKHTGVADVVEQGAEGGKKAPKKDLSNKQ